MTQNNRRWTLMVYMAGDNGKIFEQLDKPLMYGMESQGWADIQKMATVGSTKDVAVVVQFDTLSNREHTYRIYIPCRDEKLEIENISEQNSNVPNYLLNSTEYIPEQNTGDPASLTDFIVWGIQNYPAENYAVILWNHGSGWKEDDIYEFARNRGVPIRADDDERTNVVY